MYIPHTGFQWHYTAYIQYSVKVCVCLVLPVFTSVTTKHGWNRRNYSQLTDEVNDDKRCKCAVI